MNKKLKGSLTVFISLIMVSVMTLIFAMTECIRLYEMHAISQEFTDMAVESAFSEYNPYLWANYRILGVDLGYGSDSIGPSILEQKTLDYCRYNSNVDTGKNYVRLIPDCCITSQYALMTDDKGQGVVMLGVKAAKDGLAAQIIDGVTKSSDSINGIEKVSVEELTDRGSTDLKEAKEANAAAKEAAANDDDPNTNPSDYPDPGEVEDNPLDAFKAMKESFSKGILSTVVDAETLSDAELNLSEMPSHRTLNAGNYKVAGGDSIADKALFIDYLLTNYSYYGYDLKHDGMKYEIEYLVSGKESDVQALSHVVVELMLIRECANYATIMKTPSMVAEAAAIAEILAGFTMNSAIIEAVKYAIIGAWAYIESVLDVRLLLAGGKVPVIKNIDEWTSDVWHLSSFFNPSAKAKQCPNGIEYKEYLLSFLCLHSNETLAMRACDIMENALNSTEDYKNVRLDNMIFAADMSIEYSGSEMFLSLFGENDSVDGYLLKKSKAISY